MLKAKVCSCLTLCSDCWRHLSRRNHKAILEDLEMILRTSPPSVPGPGTCFCDRCIVFCECDGYLNSNVGSCMTMAALLAVHFC